MILLSNEDYKYKVVNASSTRLVIVTFELIEDRIERAKGCMSNRDDNELRLHLENAGQFVNELICSLDMKTPVAAEMADLYFLVNRLIVKANFKKDSKYLDDAVNIINRLKDGLLKEVDDGIQLQGNGASLSDTYSKH